MMMADRRNSASKPTSLQGLVLIVAAMCGWVPVVVAAAANDSTTCGRVVCPKDKCPSNLSYRHECCGTLPICRCFDRQNNTFHALQSSWSSKDCQSSCQCVKALNTKTFKFELRVKCKSLRCPASRSACQKSLERCCPVCVPQREFAGLK